MRRCDKCRVLVEKFGACPYCSRSLAILKGSSFSLARDGDYREREWAAVLATGFPAYEAFWKVHIVPLTFRIYASDNNLVRPGLVPILVDLADGSYASMFHVTQCHHYAGTTSRARRVSTEDLYCFFSHARSLMDALAYSALAVSKVALHYGKQAPLSVSLNQEQRPRSLDRWGDREAYRRYEDVRSALRRYRNLLVHQRPVFIQNGRIPKLGSVNEWCGLSAKGRLDRDPSKLDECFERARDAFIRLLEEMQSVLQSVFSVASSALDGLWAQDEKYRKDQKHLDEADEANIG